MAHRRDPRLERYVEAACATLRGDRAAAHVRAELHGHADAMIEEALLAGVAPDRAIAEAIAAMGEPATLARAFRQSYGLPGLVPAPVGYTQRPARRSGHRLRRVLLPAALVTLAVQIQVVTLLYVWPG